MATKTFRSIYLDTELDDQLLSRAQQEDSSASRLVRKALEEFLKVNGVGMSNAGLNKHNEFLAMRA
jgi:predicted transcriptional regulator